MGFCVGINLDAYIDDRLPSIPTPRLLVYEGQQACQGWDK
jgi:hypothetical protein